MRPGGASSTKAKGGFVMCAPLILVRFPPAQEINFLFALSECIFYYGTQDLSTGTKPSPSEVKPLQVVVGSFFLKKGVEGRNEPPFGAQAIQAKNAFLQQLWRDEAVKFSNGGVGEHAGQAVLSPPAAMQLYDGIQECWKRFWRGDFDRSEEHTSELQSPCNLVCRLLLEKKKKERASAVASNGPPAELCCNLGTHI